MPWLNTIINHKVFVVLHEKSGKDLLFQKGKTILFLMNRVNQLKLFDSSLGGNLK